MQVLLHVLHHRDFPTNSLQQYYFQWKKQSLNNETGRDRQAKATGGVEKKHFMTLKDYHEMFQQIQRAVTAQQQPKLILNKYALV